MKPNLDRGEYIAENQNFFRKVVRKSNFFPKLKNTVYKPLLKIKVESTINKIKEILIPSSQQKSMVLRLHDSDHVHISHL